MDDSFRTAVAPTPVYCHPDFLEKLAAYGSQPISKRASLLLQRLLIDPERLHFKGTQGQNKGWRRSRLGGAGGSHFYAWWAPNGALPVKGFEAPSGALFLRDIRHHDDHSPLPANQFPADYLPISVAEVRQDDYGPAPWTTQQTKFANARDSVRILKGHPGSGKTSALLHAADQTRTSNILYLTYSADLATLARSYFDRYCSNARRYHVTTFPAFLREFLGVTAPPVPLSQQRSRFRVETTSFSNALGPWAREHSALFDEFHAHIIGGALPVRLGRFAAARQQRQNEADYLDRRAGIIGRRAAEAAIAAAVRLERAGGPLAPRLFADLDLAWQAIEQLPKKDVPWDGIAIDECQDLTPIECLFIARRAKRLQQLRGRPVPVLIAGDEAQTVRPTDFEWAWLNDIFHAEVATPSVHHLTSNLRSPRQIANLINGVWDLYAHLEKRDRPSGQGWASIDDDANDQILYCAASPGEDLQALLANLASREGLALVTFKEGQTLAPTALTTAEIKGLDFHSVCILNPGEQLQRIEEGRYASAMEIDGLTRRLAIDQLRVAVSRPTERLIWLDVGATVDQLQGCLRFLQRTAPTISTLTPAALLKSLEEENLDLDERIQRCQEDARQYLAVRPDLAWARAHQAVSLLGQHGDVHAITDPLTRKSAYLCLAEVCFALAMRKAKLSAELGAPDLFGEAARSAGFSGSTTLTSVLYHIAMLFNSTGVEEANAALVLVEELPAALPQLPPWVMLELGQEPLRWLALLERVDQTGVNTATCIKVLPPFYEALRLPDAAQRAAQLRTTAVNRLVKARRHTEALAVLALLPERDPRLEAQCHQALENFAAAAAAHQAAGDVQAAVDCYRRVPDIGNALAAMKQMSKPHTAAPTLEWVAAMQALAAARPENFNRVIKPEEKELLQNVLESALGVQRKKAAAKKAAAKKAAPKKAAAKKTAAKKPAAPAKRTRNAYF
ncbi:MAG: hypothetical protein ACK5UT_03660 [Acidobacteriota bacterium]